MENPLRRGKGKYSTYVKKKKRRETLWVLCFFPLQLLFHPLAKLQLPEKTLEELTKQVSCRCLGHDEQ